MSRMVRVSRSSVIDAPVDALWRLLRDFNGHAAWHPAIAESHMEAGENGDLVGSVRAFHLADGSALREQLIALSDRDRELTYCLIEAPVPLVDYVATLRLRPVTDGDRTFIQWESRFRPPEDQAVSLSRLVGEGIYEAGFAALKARFGTPAARSGGRAGRPAQAAVEIAAPRPVGLWQGDLRRDGRDVVHSVRVVARRKKGALRAQGADHQQAVRHDAGSGDGPSVWPRIGLAGNRIERAGRRRAAGQDQHRPEADHGEGGVADDVNNGGVARHWRGESDGPLQRLVGELNAHLPVYCQHAFAHAFEDGVKAVRFLA